MIPTRGRASLSKKASAHKTNSPGADIYLSLKASLSGGGAPNNRESETTKGRARGKSFMVENVDKAEEKRIERHKKRAHGS